MEYSRPIIMTIAGLDPSAGAGILADIKTFEQHRCLGFGVTSALTVQTETAFMQVNWLSLVEIKAQAEPLLENYNIIAVKIGIIQDLEVLQTLIEWLKLKKQSLAIIWDPVLSSSSGFNLLTDLKKDLLINILSKIQLITPNVSEAILLSGDIDENKAAETIGENCDVLLKGGHSISNKGTDILYSCGKKLIIPSPLQDLPAKHGSGCILSAAITSNIALGHSVSDACILAKQYIEKILNSTPNLLEKKK